MLVLRRLASTLRRVDRALPQPARRTIRRLRRIDPRGGSAPRPLVSIVVTTSDRDARFLDGCLHSIRAQSHAELDIVVAIWGPSLVVRDLARAHAQDDVRINCLPGTAEDRAAAQAMALKAVRGDFLQFVRGEDLVPARAIRSLADSLMDSGADLVVGRRRRAVKLGRRVREIRAPLHGWSAQGLTMRTCPAVVSDLGLENRMFRAAFWIEHHGVWEGVGVTPAETVLRATMAAETFDVINVAAYLDMNRSVGVPVGALVDPLEDLEPWLTDQAATLAAVTAVNEPEVTDYWVSSVLDTDLQEFLDRIEVATDQQCESLRAQLHRLLELAPGAADRIRAESRVKIWLLTEGRRDALADLVAALWFENGNKATCVEGDQVYAVLPGFGEPDGAVPKELYLMSAAETSAEVVLHNVRWLDDRTLELTLFGWIDFVSYAEPPRVQVRLVALDSEERIDLPVTIGRSQAVNHLAEHRYQDYSWGELTVPVDGAALAAGAAEERRWRLEVELDAGDLHRVGGITRREDRGVAGLLAPRRIGEAMVGVVADDAEQTMLVVCRPASPAQLTHGRVDDRRLSGRFSCPDRTPVELRALGPADRSVTVPVDPDGDQWDFELRLPGLPRITAPSGEGVWALRVLTADGQSFPLGWLPDEPGQYSALGAGSVALARSIDGYCELIESADALLIDRVDLTEGEPDEGGAVRLEVVGRWLGVPPPVAELTLTSTRKTLQPATVDREPDGTWRWTFDLTVAEWGRSPLPVPCGRYVFGVTCGKRPGRLQFTARIGTSMLEVTDSAAYSWRPFRGSGEIGVQLNRPVPAEARSPYNQRQLQVACLSDARPLRPDAVYLQSYVGASATDSQLAIHRELRRRWPDWTLIWGIHDRSSWVPDDAVAVVMNSREWYDALATSRYLVSNIDFDRWFSPRPGQKFLQTFHGYPAKSMGIRLWEAKSFTPRRIAAELARTSDDWDLILTPTPEMDEHYRREYRYTGEIHSAGYPRDDDLVGPLAPEIRERTRRLLNIEPGQTVVLYAPTWRDDMATNYRNAEMAEHIDLEDASELLGPEFVFLMRGHRFHGRAGTRRASLARLIDVTHYPEINDLILASDAAVLDYSSLRFDFALTRRPMLFLVPDLASYTGSVRGFLYDFATSAPGPLLDTPDQVVAALQDLPRVSRQYAAAYETFHQAFNYLQDGAAAKRVVSAFFEPDQP